MERDEALTLLRGGEEGIAEWNRRRSAGEEIPDLTGANLREAHLRGAHPNGAIFTGADLSGADLSFAKLTEAKLYWADLSGASLPGADLSGAGLTWANLPGADLSGANLHEANLNGADLSRVECWSTLFAAVDLSGVKGLDLVKHSGPSHVSTDTLILSRGKIPEAFLRGCGVPERWIDDLPALIGALEPNQFYSCFISYSTKDEEFARRLHARMVQEELRVWFSPEDIRGG
jgi:uncharacterized protein YjbI with pentapeptide repeats